MWPGRQTWSKEQQKYGVITLVRMVQEKQRERQRESILAEALRRGPPASMKTFLSLPFSR